MDRPLPPALLDGLNDAQRAAVSHQHGPLLIVAGAGSGKTRVITRRIAALVARGVAPHRLLAITFTNKAAREMAARVEQLLPGSHAWVSTFHAAAAKLLRLGGEAIGLSRDFTICDRDDLVAIVRRLLKAHGHDPKEVRPEGVVEQISLWKNHGLSPESAKQEAHEPAWRPGAAALGTVASELWPELATTMREGRLLDFDDLLLEARRLVADPIAGAPWRSRFEHVLVDEYQDTNKVQSELADLLASGHGNLAACGDPDQSIYAWRGADLSNILEFTRRYPTATMVRLEQNYRSKGAILAVASAVIEKNVHRVERGLVPVLDYGERPRLLFGWTDNDEAELVAREIFRLIADHGVRSREIAVLYRTNALSRPFEAALRARGIAYRVVGALEFYARKEVKDLLAWLRLKANPRDPEAFLRVVNTPPRGIGEVAQGQLLQAAREAGVDYCTLVEDEARRPRLKGVAGKGAVALAAWLRWLRSAPDRPVAALLQELISVVGYESHLTEAYGEIDGGERIDNVRELIADANDFDVTNPEGGLARFLEERALVQDADDAGAERTDAVSLMTLHAAKGLEFAAVFLAGLEETRLPHRRADSPLEIEEERRLFYVGITRARERLYLSHAGQRFVFGRSEPATPSRFLHDLPPHLIDGGVAADETFDAAPRAVQVVLDDEVAESEGFVAGERVEHEKFGVGKILDVVGRGRSSRVRVVFRSGEKLLDLNYARLKKVRSHEF
ncbi:MAG: UvrD-helicase domain-containing protein [Planctomycetes bacterium]|nr:UvrD-helicase domain-containing protein [Planctomycetota bacterium]